MVVVSSLLTIRAEVEVLTNTALVSYTGNWFYVATITGHIVVNLWLASIFLVSIDLLSIIIDIFWIRILAYLLAVHESI